MKREDIYYIFLKMAKDYYKLLQCEQRRKK